MSSTLTDPRLDERVLDRAVRFLREEVAPNAAALDAEPELLGAVVQRAGQARILSLKRPAEYGGPALPETEFRRFQEEAARASGAFAFLQTQHQSAVSLIAKNASPEFARRVLQGTDDGTNLIGVGFSQLRKSGPPIVTATPEAGGYRVAGRVPWVTGYGIFGRYLLGATLPSGDSAFLLAPLEEGPRIGVTGPMRLTAMESAQTVALDLDDLLIPGEDLAFVQPADWIAGNDLLNISLQSHFAFGCARAGIDIVRAEGAKPGKEFLRDHADRLEAELDALREATDRSAAGLSAQNLGEGTAPERLRLRAHAIELAGRCAHAAVAASSGAANAIGHPAGRIYREALVYTVSAQTLPIMAATMDRLTAKPAAP